MCGSHREAMVPAPTIIDNKMGDRR